jgi:DNA repair exonuclease SbcCD ATPase subunit
LSRRIPERTKRESLSAWLEGRTFRSICLKQGVSLGAMHEIVEEARRRVPDIEDLRQLNIALRESGVALIDVVRGCPILRRLDELGVGLDRVGEYIDLGEKIALEKGVGSEALVDSGLGLLSLTKETGKTYEEILREYEERRSELQRLDGERASLAKEVHDLEGSKAGLEGELAALRREKGEAVGSWERLKRLDLKKLDRLAEFVEDYEKLGFSVEEVQRLSDWEVSLALMGVDPDGLGRFIEEKGPLEAQISRMMRESKEEERKLDSKRAESKKMAKEVDSLQGTVSKLSRLGIVLEKRKAFITCKICGCEGALVDVPSRPVAMNAISAGLVWNAPCARCGQWAQYSAWDIFAGVGLLALPES